VVTVFCGLTEAQHEQFRARGIPVVVLDPTGEPRNAPTSVGAGNWTGGLTATRHLLQLGHRRIAVITGPHRVLSSRARLDGHRAAMDAAGVRADPGLTCEGDFHAADGLEHGRRLLRLPDPPTAIVTGNDLQALGVYQAAARPDRGADAAPGGGRGAAGAAGDHPGDGGGRTGCSRSGAVTGAGGTGARGIWPVVGDRGGEGAAVAGGA